MDYTRYKADYSALEFVLKKMPCLFDGFTMSLENSGLVRLRRLASERAWCVELQLEVSMKCVRDGEISELVKMEILTFPYESVLSKLDILASTFMSFEDDFPGLTRTFCVNAMQGRFKYISVI